MSVFQRLTCAMVATATVLLSTVTADAFLGSGSSAYTIRGDRGGQIITYALRMKKMERAGNDVRFAGRCSSACTLFLALPRSRVCITPSASFGFHLPYGASAKGNRFARDYLVSKYPAWVRAWIARNGGLTNNMKTMDYAFAAKHLPACDMPRFNVRSDRHIHMASHSMLP